MARKRCAAATEEYAENKKNYNEKGGGRTGTVYTRRHVGSGTGGVGNGTVYVNIETGRSVTEMMARAANLQEKLQKSLCAACTIRNPANFQQSAGAHPWWRSGLVGRAHPNPHAGWTNTGPDATVTGDVNARVIGRCEGRLVAPILEDGVAGVDDGADGAESYVAPKPSTLPFHYRCEKVEKRRRCVPVREEAAALGGVINMKSNMPHRVESARLRQKSYVGTSSKMCRFLLSSLMLCSCRRRARLYALAVPYGRTNHKRCAAQGACVRGVGSSHDEAKKEEVVNETCVCRLKILLGARVEGV